MAAQACPPLSHASPIHTRSPTIDPFDQLGLPPTFDLDGAAIQHAYLARAGAVHPDRAASNPTAAHHRHEAIDPDAAAAALNHARAVLADPEQRAEALLGRLGGPAKDHDRSLPNGFLTEMMSLRESIDAHLTAGDRAAVQTHLDGAEARRARHIRRVGELFRDVLATPSASGPAGSDPATSTLAAIRRELNAWRYIERLIEQVESPGGAPPGSPGAGGRPA